MSVIHSVGIQVDAQAWNRGKKSKPYMETWEFPVCIWYRDDWNISSEDKEIKICDTLIVFCCDNRRNQSLDSVWGSYFIILNTRKYDFFLIENTTSSTSTHVPAHSLDCYIHDCSHCGKYKTILNPFLKCCFSLTFNYNFLHLSWPDKIKKCGRKYTSDAECFANS